jgi:predicted Fe-Mo cluster-binding NifX family protein
MKIAVTSTGTSMDSPVDPRFGRSPFMDFVELETGRLEARANPFQDATGGAGTRAAQWVVENGAEVLLTGSCGPKASTVFNDAGVQVVNGISGTVREAVASYRQQGKGSADAVGSFARVGLSPPGSRVGGGLGRDAGRRGGAGRGPGRGGRWGGRGWGGRRGPGRTG